MIPTAAFEAFLNVDDPHSWAAARTAILQNFP
jgi:hypothetical protein